jgi:pimeloyl-ACP methyl ester carboxylesterase
VHDTLSVLDLLVEHGAAELTLVGRGMGAVTAALAACVHPVVERVTLYNAPLSYEEMMDYPVVEWPRSAMALGMLRRFDLPDCYAMLQRRKDLQMIAPWDHLMRKTKDGS